MWENVGTSEPQKSDWEKRVADFDATFFYPKKKPTISGVGISLVFPGFSNLISFDSLETKTNAFTLNQLNPLQRSEFESMGWGFRI